MATLTQIRDKANAKLTDFWVALQTRQDSYFAKHGKYFQLIITDPVVDGVDTTWELRTPSDERHIADVGFSFNSPIPFQIVVDEWVGEIKGHTATATIELLNGRRFTRSRNSEQVDSGWNEIIEE